MTTELATRDTDEERNHRRQMAILKATGLDRLPTEQRELTLAISRKYELDLMLRHLVTIDGKPYITRDGLLHVAHRSGQLDGIETTDPVLVDGFWRSTCSVFRKDMSHAFTYTGRYPESGKNKSFAPEMATKVGEVMALRRAFDVSAPVAEERWDVEVPAAEPEPPKSLAEKAAEKAQAVQQQADEATEHPEVALGSEPGQDAGGVVTAPPDVTAEAEEIFEGEIVEADEPERPPVETEPSPSKVRCESMPPDNGMGMEDQCRREKGHAGAHKSREGSWPQ